jgi:hypothetical protein
MKVSYLQTGGIMGARRSFETNTRELPAAEQAKLLKMLEESGLTHKSLGERLGKANDAFTYEIKLDDGQKICTARFDDVTMPERMRPLVEYLRERAGPLK